MLAVSVLACNQLNQPGGLCGHVNPFIGSVNFIEEDGVRMGMGKTHPGATLPFGLCQVTPTTENTNENAPGYSYDHEYVDGFSFLQINGTGCAEMGNLLVSPSVGPLHTNSGQKGIGGFRGHLDKDSEVAVPGYYSAFLDDYGIKAEASVTGHGGVLRFTFPKNDESRIQIDLSRRNNGTAEIENFRFVDEHSIEGSVTCREDGGGWCTGHVNYTLYFYARCSKSMKEHGVWTMDIPDTCGRKEFQFAGYAEPNVTIRETPEFQRLAADSDVVRGVDEFEGRHIGFFTEFSTEEGEAVEFKAAVSFVSIDGARNNFNAELEGRGFDVIRSDASEKWERALSKIEVKGGSALQKRIFYTSLYHALLDPRVFEDVDGRYMGGDDCAHKAADFTRRTIFSGWDVFRSEMPLLSIIEPDVVNDCLESLVTLAEESGNGYLERWELLNGYTGCMVGNPAVSVLADMYLKGLYRHDIARAYAMADSTSRKIGNNVYLQPGNYAGISHVLECAYTEWCMARLAEALGKDEDRALYDSLSLSYRRLYDAERHSFRPIGPDGKFKPWPEKGVLDFNHGCYESNSLQQGWFVPHDVEGLAELMGGKGQALADLDTMFARTPANFHWNEYYNHSNEPVHHVPYLYNRLGQPWKTQKWTRTICNGAYGDGPEGLIGNEDVGQMSAWYILSAAGIHPVCPGDNRFEITGPIFDKVSFNLPDGKTFSIIAENNSPENMYIQSARLNGVRYGRCWIDFKDIVSGGVLELEMGPCPNEAWGCSPQ